MEQAKRVLGEARRIEDLAREGHDELAGQLRFGAIYTVGPYLLPNLVPVLRETVPQMPLMIEENFTARLLEQLLERRSEEHTSELQSLMRISYAVLCLKKKTNNT